MSPKYGDPVKFEGHDGVAPLAFIAHGPVGATANIITFDKNGAGGLEEDVTRSDEGGGRTWKPA